MNRFLAPRIYRKGFLLVFSLILIIIAFSLEPIPIAFLQTTNSFLFVDSGQNLGNSDSRGVALGDVDSDGDLDAFIANWNDQPNEVWLNDGNGGFTDSGQRLGGSTSWRVALGDLDGDNDLDAFVANNLQRPNTVWINNGAGIYTDSGQRLDSRSSWGVTLGDLDNDGDLDAFIANSGDGAGGDASTVWFNDGSGTFTDSGQRLGILDSNIAALGDVDADGDIDAVVANRNGPNQVWLNSGGIQGGTLGYFTRGLSLGNSVGWAVSLGDLDDDGDLDAFIATWNQPDTVWLNDGTGSFSDTGQRLGNSQSRYVALGDFDKDSDLDAFVANENQANLVWLNNGAGVFSDSGQRLGNFASFGVALGDLDADTDLDAFVANANGQANKVWLNQPIPNDPMFPDQWYLDKIDVLGAWSQIETTRVITVAVIDAGIDYNHVDLELGSKTIDKGKDYWENDDDAMDNVGHGTRVAGILAAETNNAQAIAGVCPQCRILPLRVLTGTNIGHLDVTITGLAEAIHEAVDREAKVINISLGFDSCISDVAEAINYAYEKDVVIVAAGGNDSIVERPVYLCLVESILDVGLRYPAQYERVISVGATDSSDKRTWFSNFGPDIMAPGVDILSNWPKLYNNDTHDDGTSYAAPIVAGVVGLLLSENPLLEPAQVEEILKISADDISISGEDIETGWGRINARKSLRVATSIGPVPTATPANCLPSSSLNIAQSNSDELIVLYRQVRDEVLSPNPVGQKYVEDYSNYGPELTVTLLTDNQLRERTVQFLENAAPAFSSLLPNSEGDYFLTQALYDEANGLVSDLANASSIELREKMLQTWENLNLDAHIGENASEIWAEMQSRTVYLPIILK